MPDLPLAPVKRRNHDQTTQYLMPDPGPKDEFENLRSKISTSSWGGRRYSPKAFTERGLYMLATILKGDVATQTTLHGSS